VADGKVPKSLRRKIFRRDGYACADCGIVGWEQPNVSQFTGARWFSYPTPEEDVYLSIDHVVPWSKGGTNAPGNLQVLCTRCNTKKGVKTCQTA